MTAATPWGIEARPVHVEVDLQLGLPQTQIVGLPDAAVRESRERVRSAIKNCGFDLPPRSVVINLAPADLRKEGNHLDLAIAVGLLGAYGYVPQDRLEGRIFIGELGLDGGIRPVRGALSIADLGSTLGAREILVPAANAGEAAATKSVPVIPLRSLAETIQHLMDAEPIPAAGPAQQPSSTGESEDLADVKGQEAGKRGLEIAAAGGHNVLLMGPPGSGKTMLARRLTGIMPELTLPEARVATKIVSLVADTPPSSLLRTRPFRSPHAGISTAGMIGGGSIPKPGEVSLAHLGVLFLDELPEFRRDTLEALRQPLEDGSVSVVRTRARLEFPARFSLVAAMNPCPCGHLGDQRHKCRCSARLIERYRSRISGPLLDRIDLHIEVPAISLNEFKAAAGERTSIVAARVRGARDRQRHRWNGTPRHHCDPVNAVMSSREVRQHCRLDSSGQALLDRAFDKLGLSARALTRILKVARTIADLAGAERISAAHVAEATQYRGLDSKANG